MSIGAILLLIAQVVMAIPKLIEIITAIMELIKKLPRRQKGLRYEARGKLGAILKKRLKQHREKGLVNADEGELEALKADLEAQVMTQTAKAS